MTVASGEWSRAGVKILETFPWVAKRWARASWYCWRLYQSGMPESSSQQLTRHFRD